MNKLTNRKGYTVKELSEALKAYPQDAKVVLSSDEEGNDFGLLFSMEKDLNGNLILWPASGTVEVE